MRRRITALALIPAALLAACNGTRVREIGDRRSPALSYAQYASLAKGIPARRLVQAFGPPAEMAGPQGRIRGLAYPCEDEKGAVRRLRLVFDDSGRLTDWKLESASGTG